MEATVLGCVWMTFTSFAALSQLAPLASGLLDQITGQFPSDHGRKTQFCFSVNSSPCAISLPLVPFLTVPFCLSGLRS